MKKLVSILILFTLCAFNTGKVCLAYTHPYVENYFKDNSEKTKLGTPDAFPIDVEIRSQDYKGNSGSDKYSSVNPGLFYFKSFSLPINIQVIKSSFTGTYSNYLDCIFPFVTFW